MKTFKLLFLVIALNLCALSFAQPSHYIYVSDAGNFNIPTSKVLRYDLDGSNPQTFISSDFFVANNVGWPQDILFLEDQGVVLISCLIGNKITKHNASTGAYIEDFADVPGGPTRMKIGADGYIYVLQWSNSINKVLRFQQDGTPMGEFTDVGVSQSIGMDWDASGNLYVSSYGGSKVVQFDTAGMSQGDFITTELSGPTNIMTEADGNFLVLNWNGGNIKRFDSSGGYIETFTTDVAQPEGIAIHPVSNNYIIGNGGPAKIDEFAPDGTLVGTIVESGSGGLMQPNAVVFRDATLAVKDLMKNKVLVTPTMGSTFKLNNIETLYLNNLEVISIVGQKVATIDLSQEIWDASVLKEGMYFLVSNEKGISFFQKIIVKK